jgi:nucleoside permease NupC
LQRFTGLTGIAFIFAIALLMSNNRRAIRLRVVFTGLALQWLLAVFVLKTAAGQILFAWMGRKIETLLMMADKGGEFVFGVRTIECLCIGDVEWIQLLGPPGRLVGRGCYVAQSPRTTY